MYINTTGLNACFFHDLEEKGAAALQLIHPETALSLALSVSSYEFHKSSEKHGPAQVPQCFWNCEEEMIPQASSVRTLSWLINRALGAAVWGSRSDFFHPRVALNDHLILKFPPSDLGLGAHRDESKYLNLIVSITLKGKAKFNIHETREAAPSTTFLCTPGLAVFMQAPGFLGSNVRPFHSVTAVDEGRTSLILKQRRI